MIYSLSNSLENLNLVSTITDRNERSSLTYDFKNLKYATFNKEGKFYYHRPELSHFFSGVPSEIIGTIKLSNNSESNEEVHIVFPMIEEGLFASSPITCGKTRPSELLGYDLQKDTLSDISEEGTISFVFQTHWDADRLTPNISPHLFYWITDDDSNGIKIFSDSNDKGKIKVIVINNYEESVISSDIVPFKSEIYSLDFRFRKNDVELIINGRNAAKKSKVNLFPSIDKMSSKLYIGGSPKSENLTIFGIMREFRLYKRWLTNEELDFELLKADQYVHAYIHKE